MRAISVLSLVLLCLLSAAAYAQEAVPAPVAASTASDPAATAPVPAAPAPAAGPFRDSLLFSGVEVAAVREAAAGRRSNTAFLEAEKVELIPVDRKIKLSGIYYKNDKTWIVWMNGHKLHPSYLLPEIQSIEVKQDEVFLRWYDIGLNDVINIRMRPHQVYDIVTGILYNDTAGGSQ